MGIISRKFNQRIKSFRDDKVIPLQAIRDARKMIDDANFPKTDDVKDLDPAHGVYVHVFNTLVAMLEQLAGLPELDPFCDIIEKAQEEYMPSGPPMSPLTRSFFTCWAFLDLQAGRDKETFASVIINAAAVKPMDREFLKVLRLLASSRMGLYEYVGNEGDHVKLRELLTNKEFVAYTPLSYRGQAGDLWFVRLLPPPFAAISYWTIYTTPYVFSSSERDRWEEYLSRAITKLRIQDPDAALSKLFKFGLSRHYWNEFVFEAYKNHITEACFLTGIPDEPMTRPHSREYQAYVEGRPPI